MNTLEKLLLIVTILNIPFLYLILDGRIFWPA
jgi:hypothetical protein